MFYRAVEHVFEVEGGYVHDERDPGGETKYGISKRAYPNVDIANLTRSEARAIYKRDYWQPLGADDLEPRLAVLAFDASINHGLWRAKRWLHDHPTFDAFLAHRLRFYARLDTFTTFGRGWVRRVASVLDAVSSLPNPILPVETLHVMRKGGRDEEVIELDRDRPARRVGTKLYVNERG